MKCFRASCLTVISAAVAAAPVLTPMTVAQSVRSKGARQVIDDLEKRGQWNAVMDAMGKGGSAWIALAPMLAPGSDAGSAEDLGISLAFALPRNPRAVLSALDPHDGNILGTSRVCGRPFIEDTEPKGYRVKAIRALSAIRDPGLSASKDACLKALGTK